AYAGLRWTASVSGNQMTIPVGAGGPLQNCTISNASPGVVSMANSYFTNEPVQFFPGGGTLPTQLVAGTTYYVSATGLSSSQFSVATAPNGVRINTSGGSGATTPVQVRRMLACRGLMQPGIFLNGVGAAGALV